MDTFGLGPLPQGWECKIEPKTGRLYFINHPAKTTTWDDPRLNLIPPPPYHVAVNQPTAYFEDAGGSRWSSPVPSLRAFSLHRRGSSPRLGGSPRIAPSPTPPPKSIRNEQLILESDQRVSGAQSSSTSTTTTIIQKHLQSQHQAPPSYPNSPIPSRTQPTRPQFHDENDACIPASNSPQPGPSSSAYNVTSSRVSAGSNKLLSNQAVGGTANDTPFLERPQSARSYTSSSYSGIPASFLSTCDPEVAMNSVCVMFPSANPDHIRRLFHKYHNRATLVVSALQVEKHPVVNDIAQQLQLAEISAKHHDGDTDTATSICADSKSIGVSSPFKGNSYTTGSPARTGTPISLLKFSNNQSSVGSLHTRWGSPLLSMSPQLQMVKEEAKLTRSPNMKLKYMRGIFPAVEESLLVDVLTSCENNVIKATEKMIRIGYRPKPIRQQKLEVVKTLMEKRQRVEDQRRIELPLDTSVPESPFPTPVMKPARPHMSAQEKEDMKSRLKCKFSNYPERFIEWALEAAMFDAPKTERLLQEVSPQTPDEFKPFVQPPAQTTFSPDNIKNDNSQQLPQRGIRFADGLEASSAEFGSGLSPASLRESSNFDKLPINSTGFLITDNVDTPDSGYFEIDTKTRKKNFISTLFGMRYDKERTFVPTSQKAKGSNLALAKGPNPSFIQSSYIQTLGPSSVSRGPNPKLRQGPTGSAHGHNPSLAKGSVWGKKTHSATKQMNINHVTVEG